MVLVVALLVAAFFAVGAFFGPRKPSPEKDTPYECGSESDGARHARLSVKFYLVAILFVVFDVEMVFLFPWAVQYRDLGFAGFVEMMAFLGMLVVALAWLWRKGALEWEK